MKVEKLKIIKLLANSIVCPKDIGINTNKKDKICGYSEHCKKCWNEALNNVSNIELIGGIVECQK